MKRLIGISTRRRRLLGNESCWSRCKLINFSVQMLGHLLQAGISLLQQALDLLRGGSWTYRDSHFDGAHLPSNRKLDALLQPDSILRLLRPHNALLSSSMRL